MKQIKIIINIFLAIGITFFGLISSLTSANAVSLDPTDDEILVAYNKSSVVKILSTYCGEFSANIFTESYEFCAGATGSGFVITTDGHIGTNGHVVSFSDQDKIRSAFFSKEVIRMFVDILAEISLEQSGVYRTQVERDALIEEIISDEKVLLESITRMYGFYQDGLIELDTGDVEYYIQKGNEVFEFSEDGDFENPTDHYKAELIASDYEKPELNEDGELEFTSSDVAILKINSNYDLPTVQIGSINSISQGSPLVVMGFPGKADSPITSVSSNTESTLTKGVVSAIKTDAGEGRNLVQTDASLGHGNSGGPAFDREGNVIGIATYVSVFQNSGDEAADFNFLRDVSDLVDLATDNNVNIAQGELDQYWRDGLEYFWNYKFTKSIEEFEKVKELYPDHPLVDDYIDRAQLGIENGEEILTLEEQVYRYIPEDQFPLVVGGLVGGCLFFLLIFILLVIFRRGGKKKQVQHQPVIPPIPNNSQPQPTFQQGSGVAQNNTQVTPAAAPVVPTQVQSTNTNDAYYNSINQPVPQSYQVSPTPTIDINQPMKQQDRDYKIVGEEEMDISKPHIPTVDEIGERNSQREVTTPTSQAQISEDKPMNPPLRQATQKMSPSVDTNNTNMQNSINENDQITSRTVPKTNQNRNSQAENKKNNSQSMVNDKVSYNKPLQTTPIQKQEIQEDIVDKGSSVDQVNLQGRPTVQLNSNQNQTANSDRTIPPNPRKAENTEAQKQNNNQQNQNINSQAQSQIKTQPKPTQQVNEQKKNIVETNPQSQTKTDIPSEEDDLPDWLQPI